MRVPLQISPGLVSDETTYSTPGNWADGENVRFRLGRAESIGGWEAYFASALSGVCRSMVAWIDNLSQTNIAFGTHSGLYVIKSGVLYDITPAGLGSGEIDTITYPGGYGGGGYGMGAYGVGQSEAQARVWSLALYGQSLVASPSGGGVYLWDNDPLFPAAIVADAPSSCNRVVVTPERQILAFGVTKVDGTFNPMGIRASDIEDPSNWTPATDNNSFETAVEGGGFIVDCQLLGSFLLIWTDNALFLGQFVDSDSQSYRFDKVASGCGLIGPQAAIVVNQTAYWMTPDLRFFAFQYGGIPTEIPCPISREFRENVDLEQSAKIVAASIGKFSEVWWFYPDTRDGNENSRYVSLNVGDQSLPWSKGPIARTAFIDSGPLAYPLGVDEAGQTYLHEKGNDADGAALSWFVESSSQYLGEGERRALLRGVWPDFEAQQGDVSLSVKTRAYPQGADTTKGPFTLPEGRGKKDFMAEGRMVALRFAASAAPTFARIGKPSFDVELLGER